MISVLRNTILCVALAGAMSACGKSTVEDSDAGTSDAGDRDGEVGTDSGTPPAACATAGATEAVACGSCGLAQRTCGADLLWGAPGTCLGEGECAPGSIDEERTDTCELRQRICNAECGYGGWTVVEPAGVCTIGETRSFEDGCPLGSAMQQVCGDTCTWGGSSGCVSACGAPPRAAPDDAREVCVPAGPFVRGDPENVTTLPVRTIEMSAFYIDTFPVTYRRYAECVATGGCTVFSDPEAQMNLLGRLDTLPVENTSRAEATAFCAWDGGRYLPSLAQWEKAARGPAPRTNQYPWDSGTICDHLFAESCGWALRPGFNRIGVPYDSLPGTRSYYGTEVQVGGPAEWVRDVWFFGWYADASSFGPDPVGTTGRMTAMSPGRVLGGGRSISYVTEFGTTPTEVGFQSTFRCARAAPAP